MKAEDRIGTIVNGWKIVKIISRYANGECKFLAQSTIGDRKAEGSIWDIKTRKLHWIAQGRTGRGGGKGSHLTYPQLYPRLHRIWIGMKGRCYNPNNTAYKYYGVRGITVCQDWLDNFRAFVEWSLENNYEDNLTIDRINPDKGYNPDNCCWILQSENSKKNRKREIIWIENYLDSARGWSLKIGKYDTWFSEQKRRHDFDYAYQCLLEEIEKLGGIKKVVGVDQEQRNRGDKSGR